MMLDQRLIHTPGLDHRNLDLDGADRVTYLLEQSFRYDYPGPVQQLRHRLVVSAEHVPSAGLEEVWIDVQPVVDAQ